MSKKLRFREIIKKLIKTFLFFPKCMERKEYKLPVLFFRIYTHKAHPIGVKIRNDGSADINA